MFHGGGTREQIPQPRATLRSASARPENILGAVSAIEASRSLAEWLEAVLFLKYCVKKCGSDQSEHMDSSLAAPKRVR
jgi:hypothetical protein